MARRSPGPGKSSAFVQTWSFWRHCCCRFGWYPILVAPIVTTACLLDLYSSIGCEFIELDVGFTPSNTAWNESTAELGLFYFNNGDEFGGGNAIKDTFSEGCNKYPSEFEDFFIDGDKTWTAARIMAIIAGSAGLLATVTVWLMIITPLPVTFFWPGVLLPSVMVGFLAQCSKFLFFDTKICQGFVWFPFGENAVPRTANTCTMGRTGVFAIAAGAIYFVSLLLVCVKSPRRRQLVENYGMASGNEDADSLHNKEVPDPSHNSSDEENPYFAAIAPLPSGIVTSASSGDVIFQSSDGVSSHHSEDHLPNKGTLKSNESNVSEPNLDSNFCKEPVSAYISAFDAVPGDMEGEDNKENSLDTRDDIGSVKSVKPAVEVRLGSEFSAREAPTSPEKSPLRDDDDDDEERGYLPYQTTAAASSRISSIRLNKQEKMEFAQPDEALIDKFVLEFERSFASDDHSYAGSLAGSIAGSVAGSHAESHAEASHAPSIADSISTMASF